MTTYTVSGDLGDLVGGPLAFPNGKLARAVLVPAGPYVFEGAVMRAGGVKLTVATDGTFSQTGVPNGNYRLIVSYYDADTRAPAVESIPVVVNGSDKVVTV